jgi:hypothetical protein
MTLLDDRLLKIPLEELIASYLLVPPKQRPRPSRSTERHGDTHRDPEDSRSQRSSKMVAEVYRGMPQARRVSLNAGEKRF